MTATKNSGLEVAVNETVVNSTEETRFDLNAAEVKRMLAYCAQHNPEALRQAVGDFAREHPDEYRETVPDVYDSQTGTFSKDYFGNELLPGAIKKAEREGKTFAVAIVDLDHFKKVNDTYGHETGDKVLSFVSGVLTENVRTKDVLAVKREHDSISRLAEPETSEDAYQVARIGGGEEFAILFYGSNLDQAYATGVRIRKAVEGSTLTTEEHGDIGVTVSIGIAEYAPGMGPELLMATADKAVYGAKERGRNRVCKARLNPPMNNQGSSSNLTPPPLTEGELGYFTKSMETTRAA